MDDLHVRDKNQTSKHISSRPATASISADSAEPGGCGSASGSKSEENRNSNGNIEGSENVGENSSGPSGHNGGANRHVENVVNIVSCTHTEDEEMGDDDDDDDDDDNSSSDSGSYYATSVDQANDRSPNSVRNNQEESAVVIVRDSDGSDDNGQNIDDNNSKNRAKKRNSSKTFCCSCCCCYRKKRKNINMANGKEVVEKKGTTRESHRKTTNRVVNCCKTFITFFFSNIGLCSLVIGYSILGGFIFQKLEAPNEENERGTVTLHRQRHVIRLWNLTEELNILHEENWSRIADEVLLDFQQEVFVAIKKQGWDGKDGTAELQWSFAGALLYSVTVITTIGYGHIAPKTAYGRIVTIFYALVGIPLTLLCLANLGSVFGTGFRCFYKHACRFLCYLCFKSDSPQPRKPIRYRPNNRTNSEEVQEPLRGDQGDIIAQDSDNGDYDDKNTNQKSKDGTRVPIIVSILLIAIYIFGGAMLFTLWEQDWDYLIGSYFCFITLSTIGFGDFVPGTSHDSWKNQEKLILCALYLVFGLALIAMCFDLMQEEVRAKCLWLGQRLGILDTEN
ncbi:TWiK family of potassium channels protein 18 [Octopus bimaculoides]|uniref:Potassium channel domain-containing protein n=1 Tax=Octopus bimaculoides TaxID=37653 RepID=A0A0L8GLX0_OCTBM|nr:TWiK family of potassium channels protein 18 [Octopus bimaculoides]XP_014780102.1 TWiK family of potassium channels protein 18 [Octopus bimaculoides]XP_014780103.1 TWiK family of potassium channels protein 18 [Octopus bimaculoides]XP_014780104.1 TWiK family of potassium channels protein 18 [Octopus bimaculoides]XP_014780105.1 TWiK family of potassium channels protein 18 [Octopus bimaculoides]XP_014780106.1 TWiK family of potassium channels protein 18 [Octopus bimaculoides]XP_052821845.1 TW|eukprot:XP_014780101.1 PREDICTED: TWiK family of potassium channels protein 18-like [Octopus bimaculoides]